MWVAHISRLVESMKSNLPKYSCVEEGILINTWLLSPPKFEILNGVSYPAICMQAATVFQSLPTVLGHHLHMYAFEEKDVLKKTKLFTLLTAIEDVGLFE